MKPIYHLNWERTHFGGVAWLSNEGSYTIVAQKGGETFCAKRSYAGDEWKSKPVGTLEEAKRVALEHDHSLIKRNFLVAKEPGVYEAAEGRIVVKRLSAPEIRKVLPHGSTTTTRGYVIFVHGKYAGIGGSLRSVQHTISLSGPFAHIGDQVSVG